MKFVTNDIGRELSDAFTKEMPKPMAVAAAGAMRDVADLCVREGRHDIALAGFRDGYFPWMKGLTSQVFPKNGRPSLRPAARIDHKVYIASVFEHGTRVSPLRRQLMWLPLRDNLPAGWPRGGNRSGPSKFSGQLKSARNARGAPLLVGKPPGSTKNVPLFVGIPEAKMPKKFHLYKTFQHAADQLGKFYLNNLKI